jgi:hypothetical protein
MSTSSSSTASVAASTPTPAAEATQICSGGASDMDTCDAAQKSATLAAQKLALGLAMMEHEHAFAGHEMVAGSEAQHAGLGRATLHAMPPPAFYNEQDELTEEAKAINRLSKAERRFAELRSISKRTPQQEATFNMASIELHAARHTMARLTTGRVAAPVAAPVVEENLMRGNQLMVASSIATDAMYNDRDWQEIRRIFYLAYTMYVEVFTAYNPLNVGEPLRSSINQFQVALTMANAEMKRDNQKGFRNA